MKTCEKQNKGYINFLKAVQQQKQYEKKKVPFKLILFLNSMDFNSLGVILKQNK